MSKECFNGDGLHPKKSPKKDFIEDKIKEFGINFRIDGCFCGHIEYLKLQDFLTSSINEAIDFGREEEYRESNNAMNAFKQQMEIKNISTRKLEDMICEIEEELDSRKI